MSEGNHTTGDRYFALVCTRQGPHGNKHRQRAFLPWDFCRAHGKAFALCKTRLSAKKRELTATRTLLCVTTLDTRQRGNLCRVPWLLHTAKSFTRPAWYDFFAVCYGLCTRQNLEIFSIFLFYDVYGTQIILAIHTYQSSHHTHFK